MKIKKPKFWDYKKKSLLSILLLPFSLIYQFIFFIHKFINSIKNKKEIPIPVICVGNIYLGGTGKTPLVREIFNIVNSFGKKAAFVKKYHNYLYDEIKMLELTGKIYVTKNREEGIFLSASNQYDVAILDDGFQDFSIKPNCSIICFNSKQLIGNGLTIPAGPLRENLNSISRAHCIIINGDKNFNFENKISLIKKNEKLPIFYSKYKIKEIEKYKNKKIIAFAGIGNPSNFFDLLKENNLDLVKTFTFPDHHKFSDKDFEMLNKEKSDLLLTTEKDFCRINNEQKKLCSYIEIDLEIENKEKFKNMIKAYL